MEEEKIGILNLFGSGGYSCWLKFRKHQYVILKKINIYPAYNGNKNPSKTKLLMICKRCGKIKVINI